MPVLPKAVSFVPSGDGPATSDTSSFKNLESVPTKQKETSSSGSGARNTLPSSPNETRSLVLDSQMIANLRARSLPKRGQVPTSPNEEDIRSATRSGSVSAPNSIIKPPSPKLATRKEAEKQRRRQSWNDLIIPREIMKNQKRLKEGRSALKMFATGVEGKSVLANRKAILKSDS